MKAKEILLLFAIVAAGILFYSIQTGKIHIAIDDEIFFRGEEFSFEETHSLDPPFPPLLKIANSHGKVEIVRTEGKSMVITLEKKIWRRDADEAKAVANKLRSIIQKDEKQISIATNRQEFKKRNFETNFSITVPADMEALDVEVSNSHGTVHLENARNAVLSNRHGKVIVKEIKGTLSIKNSYDEIQIEGVEADCVIESKHSDILVSDVKGNLTITNRHGKVHLENISQKVSIHSPHTAISGRNLKGPVEVTNSYERITLAETGATKISGHHSALDIDGVQGSLDIHNSYERIKLNHVQGNLSVEGKSLSVLGKNIAAEEILINTSHENVELQDFRGKTAIFIAHGGVTLEPLSLTHPIEVKAEYVNIVFYWPEEEKYPAELRVKGGNILWKLATPLSIIEENSVTLGRAYGEEEKPAIFLSTTYGDIRVEPSLPAERKERVPVKNVSSYDGGFSASNNR